MAFVIIEKGSEEDTDKVFPLGQSGVLIGRPTQDSTPDISIHDDYVSRCHAEISYHQGCFTLRDAGSRNGTEIDGRRIEPGKFYPLRHDSAIGLGIVEGRARVVLRLKESDDTALALVQAETSEVTPVNWLKIDEERKEVLVDGKLLPLSRKEYCLVLLLCRKARRVCSRDEIIAEVWPEAKDPGAVSDATIDQLVHRLREKIEPEPSRPMRIISKKGFGYMLT